MSHSGPVLVAEMPTGPAVYGIDRATGCVWTNDGTWRQLSTALDTSWDPAWPHALGSWNGAVYVLWYRPDLFVLRCSKIDSPEPAAVFERQNSGAVAIAAAANVTGLLRWYVWDSGGTRQLEIAVSPNNTVTESVVAADGSWAAITRPEAGRGVLGVHGTTTFWAPTAIGCPYAVPLWCPVNGPIRRTNGWMDLVNPAGAEAGPGFEVDGGAMLTPIAVSYQSSPGDLTGIPFAGRQPAAILTYDATSLTNLGDFWTTSEGQVSVHPFGTTCPISGASMSVCGWVRCPPTLGERLAISSQLQYMAYGMPPAYSDNEWTLYWDPAGLQMRARVEGYTWATEMFGWPVAPGYWVHLALTVWETPDTGFGPEIHAKFYLNGVNVTTGGEAVTAVGFPGQFLGSYLSEPWLMLSKLQFDDPEPTVPTVSAGLADWRLYARTLSDGEIAAIYTAGEP